MCSAARTHPATDNALPSVVALGRFVAYGFYVMPVKIQDERAEVILVIVGPGTRQAVVLGAGLHGGFVEGGHGGAVLGEEGHMGMALAGFAGADPEIRLVVAAEACAFVAAAHLLAHFHDERDA